MDQENITCCVGYFEYACWRVTLSMIGEEEGYRLQESSGGESKSYVFDDIGSARDAFEKSVEKCIGYTSRSMVIGQTQHGPRLAADRLVLTATA